MMECDPLKAIRAMLRHNAVCRAVVEANGGRIIKELGDGVMVMFDNVGTAVECAAKVIRCVKEHGGGTHTQRRSSRLERSGVRLTRQVFVTCTGRPSMCAHEWQSRLSRMGCL